MSSFAIYLIGYVVLLIGLGLGAYYLHVPAHWVVVGILVFAGIGITGAVARTRQKDPS
ncbi:MAG TPA: hypothetical protein VH351_22680 [Bryobacteraceae bacterium]|jgi:heme A synthase|nr:hypothetical protein [Bryobacteraceae bacterium]